MSSTSSPTHPTTPTSSTSPATPTTPTSPVPYQNCTDSEESDHEGVDTICEEDPRSESQIEKEDEDEPEDETVYSDEEEEPQPPKKKRKTHRTVTVKALLEEKLGNLIRELETMDCITKRPGLLNHLKQNLSDSRKLFVAADSVRTQYAANKEAVCNTIVTQYLGIPISEIPADKRKRLYRYADFVMKITA